MKLKCLGYTTTKFQLGTKFSKQVVYVCQDIKIALLGNPANNPLELVKLNIDGNLEIEPSINEIKAVTGSNKFIKEYPEVFHGLGCMTGEPVQIELQENAVPYL